MAVDDSYTKSLLHFDGNDGSTTFTDESGKTWKAYGNAQIDTAQYVFGGASGLFDGAGDYIETADHTDWTIGSGDFTIDFRMRPSSIDQNAYVVAQSGPTGSNAYVSWGIKINTDESVLGSIFSSTTQYLAKTAAGAYAANTWYHVALVRYGGTLTLYLNGTAGETTANVTGVTANDSAYKLAIGRLGEYDGLYYKGWVDEFRFSKGIARWTSNFTPPTSAYIPLPGPPGVKTINGIPVADIKTINGVALADVKSVQGLT